MPRLHHEPWCSNHDEGTLPGSCATHDFDFGPKDTHPEGVTLSRGMLSAMRCCAEDLDVHIDYLIGGSVGLGRMDGEALRAIHEALRESPVEFAAAVAALVAHLGDAIPRAAADRLEARAS